VREDDAPDGVRELEAPRARKREERGAPEDAVAREPEPERVLSAERDERKQARERRERRLARGAACNEHVPVAARDVEEEAGAAEDHEGLVQREVGQ
jgi:hypothetical protein